MHWWILWFASFSKSNFNGHDADMFLRSNFSQYSEGKQALARAWGLAPGADWVREPNTRVKINELRNTLRRFNDEQGLGLNRQRSARI
jgi:hypothetical protein